MRIFVGDTQMNAIAGPYLFPILYASVVYVK